MHRTGFVVLAGSQPVNETVPSIQQSRYLIDLRESLKQTEDVSFLRLDQD